MNRQSTSHYDAPSRAFHWLTAVLVTIAFILGAAGFGRLMRQGIEPVIANSAIAKLADWGDVHQFLGDAILWPAGLHAAAAIYHPVFLKDGVLLSMLPAKRPH